MLPAVEVELVLTCSPFVLLNLARVVSPVLTPFRVISANDVPAAGSGQENTTTRSCTTPVA